MVHGHKGTRTTWEGTLRLKGAGETFELTVRGELVNGAITKLPGKVDVAIRALLQGVPFRQIPVTQRDGVRAALADRCGIDSHRLGLASCSNERLTRIGAKLLFECEGSVAEAAASLREPVELVEAVLQQLDCGRTTWPKVLALAESLTHDRG